MQPGPGGDFSIAHGHGKQVLGLRQCLEGVSLRQGDLSIKQCIKKEELMATGKRMARQPRHNL